MRSKPHDHDECRQHRRRDAVLYTGSATTSTTSSANSSSSAAANAATNGVANLASDFTSFLQPLTTQLQSQNPLDPLDTNQFTQELVSFTSVEQQINMNANLSTLISLQQTAQSTAALGFLGTAVTVNGNSAQLGSGQPNPTWNYTLTKPSTVTINVSSVSSARGARLFNNPDTPGRQPNLHLERHRLGWQHLASGNL